MCTWSVGHNSVHHLSVFIVHHYHTSSFWVVAEALFEGMLGFPGSLRISPQSTYRFFSLRNFSWTENILSLSTIVDLYPSECFKCSLSSRLKNCLWWTTIHSMSIPLGDKCPCCGLLYNRLRVNTHQSKSFRQNRHNKGKLLFLWPHLTQHNIEPKENSLVPTIMINSNGFKVCLYDCEHDILLISEVKNIAQQGHLSPSGILMLWIVVHHRQFLRHWIVSLKHSLGYKSTIVDKLKMFSVHEKFLKLKNLYVDWGDIRRDPEGPTYPRTELLPPLKKMKYDSGEQ